MSTRETSAVGRVVEKISPHRSAGSMVKEAPPLSSNAFESDFVHNTDSRGRGAGRPFVRLRYWGDCGRDVVHRSRLPPWRCRAGTRGQRRDLWRVVRSAARWNLL